MSSAFKGPSYEDAIAFGQRMIQNPADSVSLAGQLATMIANLPPPSGELLSRPHFERASLWTLGCTFENVEVGAVPPPAVIQAQSDVWIRGVSAQAYPLIVADDQETFADFIAFYQALKNTEGTNGRPLFDVNWRIDGKQGFISGGATEVLSPATLVAGDGYWSAPLDWRLQKTQTIEVRVQSRMNQVLPVALSDVDDTNRVIRYLSVAFWVEEISSPSVSGI
jgi:hypothetical protein